MNPNRRQLLATSQALLGAGLLAGCTGSSPAPETRGTATGTTTDRTTTTDRPPSDDTTTSDPPDSAMGRVVAGNTDFGFDLLSHLSAKSPEQNLHFSPYSASVALAMTYAGAKGETRREMRETLHFPRESPHGGFRQLRDALDQYAPPETPTTTTPAGETTERGVGESVPFQLAGANAIWGQTGFPFLESFVQTLARNYGAGLHELDFQSNPEEARLTINEWVADRTRGKITDLLPPKVITEMTRLVLTNAVYFQANWAKRFQPEQTDERTFTALSGREQTVPMMRQTEEFRYAAVNGHQLVALPYEGGDVSMVVALPAEGEFEKFQQSLSATRLRTLLGSMESRRGTVTMPQFTFGSKFSLAKTLAEMGMPSAFGARANLTGMAKGDAGESLFIDDVVHESYVSVDEEGTEAAAATAVVVAESATTETQDRFEMTVDRPFLFLIRDDRTGAVLFVGRVVDAEAAQEAD